MQETEGEDYCYTAYQWRLKDGEARGNLNNVLSLAAYMLCRDVAKVRNLKALQTGAEMKPPFLLSVLWLLLSTSFYSLAREIIPWIFSVISYKHFLFV